MSESNNHIIIVNSLRLGPGGLHRTRILRGQGWARAVKGSESLRPVARDVEIGRLAEVGGGAASKVANEHGQWSRVRSGNTYDAYKDAQGWWDREGGAWRGRRGSAWPETARNSRFGRSEVVGGRSGRVRRGLPRRHQAGDHV